MDEQQPPPPPALTEPGRVVFVDAYGDTNLKVELGGASGWFIIAAVVVPAEDVTEASRRAEVLRRKHFQTGEIKSQTVARNDDRRIRILQEIAAQGFRFCALAIDKSKVSPSSGLVYKESFLKFAHRLLFQRLYRANPAVELVMDEHGWPEFMASFRRYVQERAIPDLFWRSEFRSEKSHAEPLISYKLQT